MDYIIMSGNAYSLTQAAEIHIVPYILPVRAQDFRILNQMFALCTARTAWFDAVIRPISVRSGNLVR